MADNENTRALKRAVRLAELLGRKMAEARKADDVARVNAIEDYAVELAALLPRCELVISEAVKRHAAADKAAKAEPSYGSRPGARIGELSRQRPETVPPDSFKAEVQSIIDTASTPEQARKDVARVLALAATRAIIRGAK